MNHLFIGIDVCKKHLDACALAPGARPTSRRFDNDAKGQAGLLEWALSLAAEGAGARFCMESTGGYELELASLLAARGLFVSVENPRRIKAYAQAAGLSNKTDRADARAIAGYLMRMDPRPWSLAPAVRRELALLLRHREGLLEQRNAAASRLEHERALPAFVVSQLRSLLALLDLQLEEAERERSRLVRSDEGLRAQVEALCGIPGVREATAALLLSEMGDARGFERAEEWAAQAGLFPRRRESGDFRGASFMSKAGNAHVRRALFMPAMSARRWNAPVRDLADRMRDKGRKPVQILVACMRKLLLQCYGVLKALAEGREPVYHPVATGKTAGKAANP